MFFSSLCSEIYGLGVGLFLSFGWTCSGPFNLETQVFSSEKCLKYFIIDCFLSPLFSFWNSFGQVLDSCTGPLIFLLLFFSSCFPHCGSHGSAVLGSPFKKKLVTQPWGVQLADCLQLQSFEICHSLWAKPMAFLGSLANDGAQQGTRTWPSLLHVGLL